MLPQADKLVTIIEEAQQRILRLGIAKEKICIVSNTINYDNLTINTVKKDSDRFILFYGGAINIHRGLQIVIRAIKITAAKNQGIRLWIVGDGSYRKSLEELSISLGIGNNVKFFGHKPFKEMLEIMAESDAAIIPHIRTDNNDASSPNKLYQYMYLNKPIISSDCTSLKRIITETGTGFIYNNESAEELASLIEKLNGNRGMLTEINDNGRKAVMEKYNWNIDKLRLTNAYSQLLPGPAY